MNISNTISLNLYFCNPKPTVESWMSGPHLCADLLHQLVDVILRRGAFSDDTMMLPSLVLANIAM